MELPSDDEGPSFTMPPGLMSLTHQKCPNVSESELNTPARKALRLPSFQNLTTVWAFIFEDL